MKRTMVLTADMTMDAIVVELGTIQKRKQELLQLLASKISKETSGEFHLSDDNKDVPKYWLGVLDDLENFLPRAFDKEDFQLKALAFETFVGIKKTEEKVNTELKAPRDIISRDCYWYISYLIRLIKPFESDPVVKKILQNAPILREGSKKPPSDNSGTAGKTPTA